MIKRCFVALAMLATPGFCSGPLDFGTPSIVPDSSLINSSVPVVSFTENGLMLDWQDGSNDVIAQLSTTLGSTWESPLEAGSNASAYPWLAGNQTGFVAARIELIAGFSSGNPMVSLYDILSNTWDSSVFLHAPGQSEVPILVGSSPTGFIATWRLSNNDIYANVSLDGVTWQNPSINIGSGYTIFGVTGCGNSEKFLAAWNDQATQAIYVVTSSDNGSSWTTPAPAASVSSHIHNYCVGSFANSQGFLLAYADADNKLWSIFSTDGITWSSPSLIATNLLSFYDITPSIGGTDSGFVVAWTDSSNNAKASFSKNNGTSWSVPAAITTDGSVVSFVYAGVTISAYNDHCVATWQDSSNNAWISVSSISESSGSSSKQSSGGFNFRVTPNKPGFQMNR